MTGVVASRGARLPDLLAVRIFVLALTVLLAGYMFLGRGFAHLGLAPIYVGELVLAVGVIASATAFVRRRFHAIWSPLVWVLLLFMLLGAARTVPFLGQYGADALRDAALWGYGLFALILLVLADGTWVRQALRIYGRVVPLFAIWLPIYLYFFTHFGNAMAAFSGADVPILFFKNQDMAVHTLGAIAFLIVGGKALPSRRWSGLWCFAIAIPLAWAVITTGSVSRGALAAVLAGLLVLALSVPRSRNWLPVIAAVVLVAVFEFGNLGSIILGPGSGPGPSPTPLPTVARTPFPGESPTPSPAVTRSPAPSPSPVGRAVGPEQWLKNITSVLAPSTDVNLEGTKNFRLAWWSKIVGYTISGPYFWNGKGFGVNLADEDGFQPTADRSLRTPHNASFDVLARMGVPGLILWIVLQLGFFVSLTRSMLAHRRAGDLALASAAVWILAYWTAIMVNSSFDPYLEGPQGGIWFWVLFGLGLAIIRSKPRPSES